MTNLTGCSVLIVEPDYSTASLIQYILEDYGAESVTVPNVKKAIQVLNQKQFNVVVSKHTLRDGNIKDLIHHTEQYQELRNVSVVCLTGGLSKDVENLCSTGVRKVLVKPFGVEELTETVKSLVPNGG